MRFLIALVSVGALAQSVDWSQIKNKPTFISVNSNDFKFTRTNGQGASGDLSVAGAAKVITLTPCPKLNGTDTNKYVYISGGTGTAEAVPVTGGTCTSAASTGTIQVTTSNTHSGAWVMSSASDGIDEAIRSLNPAGGYVTVPSGIHPIYSPLVIYEKYIKLIGTGSASYDPGVASGAELKYYGSSGGTLLKIQGPNENAEIINLRLNMNSLAAIGLHVYGCERCRVERNNIFNPINTGSTLLALDAVDSTVGSTAHSIFTRNLLRGDVNGAKGIVIGATPPAPGLIAGSWANEISYNHIKYQSDSATSNGIELRWADNNEIKFNMVQAQTLNNAGGLGAALLLVQQSLTVLPSENKLIGNQLGNHQTESTACRGTSGTGGTHFINWQIVESGVNECLGDLWIWTSSGQFATNNAYGWRFKPKMQIGATGANGEGLLLYHDGADSYIRARDSSTTNEELRIGHDDHGDMVILADDGSVTLKNNSYAAALKTTTDGYVTVGSSNYFLVTPVNYATLSGVAATNGTIKPCSDCQVTSGSDNTCTSGGTGALAVRLNGAWKCFANQN